MTRILYVHHGKGIGGAPLSLLYLIRGLDRTEFMPTVLCLHESEAAQLFRDNGIETIVDQRLHDFSHTNVLWYPWWQFPKTLLRLLQFPWTYLRARRFFATHRFDLLHLNTSTLTAFGLAAHHEDLPVVWHIREPLHAGYFGLRRALIRRIIHRCASIIIPICHYDADQLLPTDRIHVVYNFVDFTRFDHSISGAAVRAELDIEETAPVALMLGGVNPVKGTLEFVSAAVRVLEAVPDAVFLIAGPQDGGGFRNTISGRAVYGERVRSIIPQRFENRIRFLGIRNDIPELLASSDVLCFPSTVPHFARPVIEASAMGVAVVASDLGGPRELVRDGETGVLVPARDVHALAAALVQILSDPGYRERLGDAGRHFALEEFDSGKNTARIVALYRTLIESTLSA
ncbi:MAG: glycosyltransferase family 4 protein [Bacteroidia bacterium]|nr:glycosyltransferase family 4 protein [Bacteroidia bacterium]